MEDMLKSWTIWGWKFLDILDNEGKLLASKVLPHWALVVVLDDYHVHHVVRYEHGCRDIGHQC